MTIRKLEKSEWRPFLEGLSTLLQDARAEIEVASLRLGDQIEVEWLPLLGMTYDAKNDLIQVALDGVDHMIRRPRQIYIDEAAGDFISLAIIDADGTKEIVKLREPLMLPSPPVAAR
jgi:hypothetical protein